MNKTCNLPPASRVEGMSLATFLARRVRKILTLALLLGVVLSVSSSAQTKFSIVGKTPFTLPFELIDNRIFVEVFLGGRGPLHFILDTGASGFSLTDTAVQKLGLQVMESGQGPGVGENTVRVGKTHIAKLRLGGLQFEDVDASVLPGGDSDNVFGKKPVDGVVGLAVFERVVVKHDYIHKLLTFIPPQDFHYQGRGLVVPFDLPRHIPVVDAELDGVRGRFGIDTGARSSLLLYGPFVGQNKLAEKYHANLEGVTGWGIGGSVRSLLARARELKIGAVVVRDLVIRLSTQRAGLTTSSEMAGLIGPDVLAQFDVTVDYSRHQLVFEKNRQYGRRDSYDRAGLWMGQDGDRFTVVDVIAGGPAAQAGVQQGESILAIGGVSTSKLLLPDARERIRRAKVGRKVTLLVETNGKQRRVTIVLQDLV